MGNYSNILRSKIWGPNDIADLIDNIFGNSTNAHDATWYDWVPTYGASGAMTFTGVTTDLAKYTKIGKLLFIATEFSGTTGGVASTDISQTLPVIASLTGSMGIPVNIGLATTEIGVVQFTATGLNFRRDPFGTNWSLGAGRRCQFVGAIRCV